MSDLTPMPTSGMTTMPPANATDPPADLRLAATGIDASDPAVTPDGRDAAPYPSRRKQMLAKASSPAGSKRLAGGTNVLKRDDTHPKHWRALGIAHRRRDEAAASIAEKQDELAHSRAMTSLVRWPAIVQAIKSAIADYNEGVGCERLQVKEAPEPEHPSVTIESSTGMVAALVITLDGAELAVGSGPSAPGMGGIQRWVAMTRTDDETAAYLLQEWMERL